jgi:hypothetical protein
MDGDLNPSNNSEIDKALKEFEMKSSIDQTQYTPKVPEASDMPKMVKLVIKLSGGAIKERRQAEYVLLGFVVLVVLTSVFLFLQGGPNTAPPTDIDVERAGSFLDFEQ